MLLAVGRVASSFLVQHLTSRSQWHASADIMPREIEDALLAMAALRARAGTPLTIYVGPGTSEQQLERWNSLMAVIRRDAGQMQQNQVLFQGMPHSDGW